MTDQDLGMLRPEEPITALEHGLNHCPEKQNKTCLNPKVPLRFELIIIVETSKIF